MSNLVADPSVGIAPGAAGGMVDVEASRFPHVNLLPDTVYAHNKEQRARLVMVGAVGGAVVATIGLFALATADATSAQNDYDRAVATGTMLHEQASKYAEVPAVTSQYEAARTQLATAMAPEVQWSSMMGRVASLVPTGVAFTQFTGTLNAPGTLPTASGGAAPVGVGAVTFTGEASNVPLVARWLDTLAKDKEFAGPFATGIQRGSATAGTAPGAFAFQSSATLTPAALSHRFDTKADGS